MIHAYQIVVLAPFVSALLLVAIPGYRVGAVVNVLAIAATFAAGLWLLFGGERGRRRLRHRRRVQHRLHRHQHPGRLHHLAVQRLLYRPRDRNRPPAADLRAILSRHVPGHDGLDELALHRQQYRRDVGRAGTGDPDHGGHGRSLSHAAGHRGGVEIFHPGERRHFAGVLRHHPDLPRRAAGAGRGCAGDDLEPAAGGGRAHGSGDPRPRLHLPADRLRHQGRAGAVACLAARCPCRGADADLGGALGPAAECGALCAAALQDDRGRPAGGARSRAGHDRDGTGIADLRRLHAVPAPRHQTAVRLFLDRAYGPDRVRLRHGRAARQFRRPAAHGDAQPDQVRQSSSRSAISPRPRTPSGSPRSPD